MNVNDIRIQAQLHHNMPINNQYTIKYINECMMKLANQYTTACILDHIKVSVLADTPVELPNDLLHIRRVKKSNDKYTDFEIFNNSVVFNEDGEYEIDYFKYPKLVSADTETPSIHMAYHYALALFVASREKSRMFGDEETDSIRLMQEFERACFEAHTSLSRQKRTPRFIKAPNWG